MAFEVEEFTKMGIFYSASILPLPLSLGRQSDATVTAS